MNPSSETQGLLAGTMRCSGEKLLQVTLLPSYTTQFSSSINLAAWPVQWGDCCGKFQKKAKEITRLNMHGANTSHIADGFLVWPDSKKRYTHRN